MFSSGNSVSSVQYIIDATADIESATESIASDLWTSGTKVMLFTVDFGYKTSLGTNQMRVLYPTCLVAEVFNM